MEYTLYLYGAERETIAAETIAAAYVWNGGKAENTAYSIAAARLAETPTAAAFRVYPTDCTAAALQCATAAARTAAHRGGKAAETAHAERGTETPTEKAAAEKAAAKMRRQGGAARAYDTQSIIFDDLRRITAATAAAAATETANGGTFDFNGYVFEKIAAAAQDTQDFFSVAILAAYENATAAAAERAAAIYTACNAYTRGNVTRRERETSTEYILDGGGDLVSWGTAAAYILHGGEKWTPTAAASMDMETALFLGETLAAAFSMLRPTEREIVKYIVNGYSIRATAAKMRRDIRTTARNVENVRRTFAAYIAEHAPMFSHIITAATAAAEKAAERKAATDKKAAAARREREKNGTAHGKTAAERMREYRERRKAAEKAAERAAAEKAAAEKAAAAERAANTIVTAAAAAMFTTAEGKIVTFD